MIVHCKKAKFDTYIGRPSKWGNPYVIGKDGTREEVIKKYDEWIRTQPHLLRDLDELRGKTLGCWCNYPKENCHGSILIKLLTERKIDELLSVPAMKLDENGVPRRFTI